MESRGAFLLMLLFMTGYYGLSDAQTKSPLRVSAVLDSPYLFHRKGKYVGFLPDLLDKLNLTYDITLSPDSQYGIQYKNGSWTGMVGELVKGDADIAGLLTMVTPRSDVIDFSYPIMPVNIAILISVPTIKHFPALTRLFDPFDFSVWLMAIIVFFVVGSVLYLMMRFNPYEWRRMARDHEVTSREGESFTCQNTFFFITSTLMWQGYEKSPRSIGARVLVAAWWIFSLILIVAYTANLTNLCSTGFVTIPSEKDLQITSLSDVALTNIRAGFIQGGATNKFFQEAKSPVHKKVYNKVINDPNFDKFKTTDSLLKQIRMSRYDDGFAAIVESPTSRYIVNRKPCDILEIKEDLSHSYYAFGLQKGSHLAKGLNSALIKLTENGDIHELEKKWFDLHDECSDVIHIARGEGSAKFYKLDLKTFTMAILIVILGIVFGVVIFLVEICVYKYTIKHGKGDETKPMTVDETCSKPDEDENGGTPAM